MPTIVDQIRKALERRDGLSEEVMAPLAAAYADEVDRVNERLGEVVGLLRKGLRSEAIQRASLNPNAIEGAANLDFPEIGEWLEILQFLGVSVPPQVDQDAAQQLNEAIVETQPLNELLNRHRKLAIAKAPLAWRLTVLRRIAQVDPMNAVWEEDLEAWEDVRLKQIPAELQTAVNAGDTRLVVALHEELSSQSWRIEPSARLVERAKSAANRFEDDANTETLQRLAQEIHDAFGEFDEAAARQVRDQWRQTQAELNSPVPIDLQDQIGPAFAWLDELDRETATAQERAESVATLEAALDNKLGTPDLHRAYQRASRFEEPMPSELEQRYRVTIAEHELRAKRKTQAILTSIAAVTLLLAGWIGFRQWSSKETQRVDVAATQMKTLLDDGKLSEAEQFWDQIRTTQPKVAASATMASLSSQLSGQLESEENRAVQFESYLEKTHSEDPSLIDTASLAKAESLAKTEKEKAAVFEIQRRRDQWERELQAEHTASALDQLEAYRKELETIESGSASVENIKAITILVDKINSIGAMHPRRSTKTDAQIELIKRRAMAVRDAMRKQSQQMQSRSDAVKRLLGSSSLAAFADNLDSFTREVPDSRMTKEFSQVVKERPLWERTDESNKLMKLIRNSLVGGLSPDEATAILQTHQTLTEAVAINPALDPIPRILSKLAKVQDRAAALDKVFNDLALQTVAELITIEVPDREDSSREVRYFLYYSYFDQFRDRFNENGRVGIEVVVNESAAVQMMGFVGPLTIIPEPRATVRWLINKKEDQRQRFLSDWNRAFLETAAELRKRPDLDGMVKETLLLQLLKGGAEGSDLLADSLADAIKFLERRSETRKRWFVPKPLDSALDPNVEQLVVPELSKAYRDRHAEWTGIEAASKREYQWVGCLVRHDTGSIMAQINHPPESDGDLFVVRPAVSDPSKVDFAKVGDWKNDQAVLGSSLGELVAGRPLFFLPKLEGG